MGIAVVTGAASGIGRATAAALLETGWRVVVADLDEGALRSGFHDDERVLPVRVDVSDSGSIRALFEAADGFGQVTGVAHAAGITSVADQRVEDVDEELFDRTIAVNLRGTFLVAKHAVPRLRAAGGGTIVNVGSLASLRGAGGAAYVSSKHGVLGLSRTISAHYTAENIRCVTVAPGAIDTPMLALARQKPMVGGPPPGTLPRDGRPEEVAALIRFLLSEDAAFISGGAIAIDGGATQY